MIVCLSSAHFYTKVSADICRGDLRLICIEIIVPAKKL